MRDHGCLSDLSQSAGRHRLCGVFGKDAFSFGQVWLRRACANCATSATSATVDRSFSEIAKATAGLQSMAEAR